MRCNKCNSEIIENSKFCQVCGNQITTIESVVSNNFNNSTQSQNVVQDPAINLTGNENLTQINNNVNINNENLNYQQSLNQNNIEQPIPQTNNQQIPQQNNNNNNEKSGLKTASTLLGVIGIVVMFFHSTIASIIFIIGIILGAIYKSKTKNKCFGLTLNIIGLILNIIFFIVSVFLLTNLLNEVTEKSKCTSEGGYWNNGECVGATIDKDEEIKEEEKENNNSNIDDNSFNSSDSDENNTYVGLWSCKDNGANTSMKIESLDEIDDNDYKIGLTFVNSQKYMITYSSSKWEKGTYTISLNKTDSNFTYYNLNLTSGELYESGNYQITDSIPKQYQFIVDESYSRAFVIAIDGSTNYSCYKN